MEWDQIADNWAAMAKRLCGERPVGVVDVSVTSSGRLLPRTMFRSEAVSPTLTVPGNELLDQIPPQ